MNVLLHELPADHRLRNAPLRDIGAEMRNRHQQNWRLCGTWHIGAASYNTLGAAWHECNEFRAKQADEGSK